MKKFFQKLANIYADSEPINQRYLNALEMNNELKLIVCLKKGINPNSVMPNGNAALHIVAEWGYTNLLEILLNQVNIDINIRNAHFQTPLYIASMENRKEILVELLKKGANVNIPDKNRNTPLHIAVLWKYEEIVNILLNYKPKVNAENVFGKTPLYIAALDNPCIPIFNILIENGADVNLYNGKTLPLIIECTLSCHVLQNLKIIELLLDNGANINIYERYTKRTALHTVAITGYLPLAEMLVNRGGDTCAIDFKGYTPCELATQNQQILVAAVLCNQTEMFRLI